MSRQNVYDDIPRRASRIDPSYNNQKFVVPSNNVFPSNPSRLLNNQNHQMNSHIEGIASHSNTQDMVYFEYEVVDKQKEEEVINNKLRTKGLCLCRVNF